MSLEKVLARTLKNPKQRLLCRLGPCHAQSLSRSILGEVWPQWEHHGRSKKVATGGCESAMFLTTGSFE